MEHSVVHISTVLQPPFDAVLTFHNRPCVMLYLMA